MTTYGNRFYKSLWITIIKYNNITFVRCYCNLLSSFFNTRKRSGALYGLVYTIILAVIFTAFQGIEYTVSSFTISDGTYSSCFYFGTGFHGLHVIIGTAFLAVGLWRLLAYHLTENHHLGYESGILYWHFVDVVWLFLFISIYYWGS